MGSLRPRVENRANLLFSDMLMRVTIIIEKSRLERTRHVADLTRKGDLLTAVGAAMEAYRKAFHDLPLFDHSSIRIERE